MKRNISEERRERIGTALGNISDRFIREVWEEDGKTAAERRASRTHPAPAWLRPVAACLAVLILGGLVVFSIPVVNNIISRRGPAELPGTDPVAEADTTEETKKKEETEAPVETEEIEVSQFDKKFSIGISKTVINMYGTRVGEWVGIKSASFNDIFKDEHRFGVAAAEDAEKITVGMSLPEVNQILGAEGIRFGSLTRTWALDDGRSLHICLKLNLDDDTHEPAGGWDEEHAPISQIFIYDEYKKWEVAVEGAIKVTGNYYYTLGLIPEWGK